MFCRRIAGLMARILGFLGVVACLAGAWAVWLMAARCYDANERLFASVDRGLGTSQNRVRSVQKRVETSRITNAEINQKVRDWAVREAKDRIVQQLEIEAHADKLAAHLQTADSWLEASTETLRGIQQLTALGQAFGAHADPASLDEILEKLESIQSQLKELEQSAHKVRDLLASKEDETSRLAKVAKLLARTMLTISELDSRLEDAAGRLGALRTESAEWKARTDRWILWSALACWAILLWIAAGQAALCRCGWKAIGVRPSS